MQMATGSRAGGWRKKAAALVALLAVCAVAAGGTLAWQDYRQHKSNELGGIKIKYEARLVEDFEEVPDWKVGDCDIKKEIRVTNLGQAAAGYGAVYVRVQLKEFMQIGAVTYVESEKRYMIDTEGQFLFYASEATARTAWPGHNVAQLTDFVTGRTGWFIETKDQDPDGQMGKHVLLDVVANAAAPVIPGSVLAADKNHHGYYDASGNFVTRSDECDYPIHGWGSVDATAPIDRYVEWLLGNDVILMSQWDGTPVRAWIIDDEADGEGWAYWGQPLATDGETTSNLLEAVRLIEQPDGNFYYVIHTEMEAISIDEFTNGGDGENWKAKVGDSYWNNRPRIDISGAATTVKERETVNPPASVTVLPAGSAQGPLVWSSGNPALASVDPATGVVTGVKAGGPVTIIARAPNGARGQYSLMVTPGDPVAVPVTGVTLDKTTMALAPAGAGKLTAAVSPANATNKAVIWTSSNPSVATVDANGNVTAVAPGTAAVTVTTADGGKTATCAVTVAIPADPAIPVKANEFTVHGSENEEDNYAFVAAIDLGDFEHPQMVWQPGSVKLSEILPSSFNTAGLTVTAVPETLNGYVSIGQDWKNDPALLITYYGTKAQWEAAIANLTTPAVQMTLVLHKAGYQDAAIKVNLSFEGSNIS